MVTIRKVESRFDFSYEFDFDYKIDLQKAHKLNKYPEFRYTRWAPLKVPARSRAIHPEDWQVVASPHTYPYPHVVYFRDKQIVVSGWFPIFLEVSEKVYLYNLMKRLFGIIQREGIITLEDYESILDFFTPAPVPKELIVEINGFKFRVKKDWKYKVLVETPSGSWLKDWQVSMFGDDYSVKHRTIMFLETMGVADRYFAGYRWVRLSEEAIRKRLEAGRVLKVWRTMQYDPNNRIDVREIGVNLWEVDFSRFRRVLPSEIDLVDLEMKSVQRGYHYEIVAGA